MGQTVGYVTNVSLEMLLSLAMLILIKLQLCGTCLYGTEK